MARAIAHAHSTFSGGIILDSNPNNDYRRGSLPPRAPLASAYVPLQDGVEPHYAPQTAIGKGTLFPGLDLPFRGMVNRLLPESPLGELMAIDFVADELELYLDTHKDDREAFEMYQSVLAIAKTAHENYVRRFGPVCQSDLLGAESYSWLCDPWPWEYCARKED